MVFCMVNGSVNIRPPPMDGMGYMITDLAMVFSRFLRPFFPAWMWHGNLSVVTGFPGDRMVKEALSSMGCDPMEDLMYWVRTKVPISTYDCIYSYT